MSRVQLFIIIATTGYHILKVVYACMHEQSPNHISLTKIGLDEKSVEGLVKLLRRMTSGRRWVYIPVDVGRHGTSGEVQSAVQ